jgi:hypothetical protein
MTVPSHVELAHAGRCLERHANRQALSLLAAEVMASWADARALVLDPKDLAERAARAGIDHANAGSELGNLFRLLERGPGDGAEFALVSVFAAHGFGHALDAAHDGELEVLSDRLVARIDWVEAATDYRIGSYVLRGLSEPAQQALLDALRRAVLREDLEQTVRDPAARARNALRLTTLASARGERAKSALRKLKRQADDPATRALAELLLGELAQDASAAGPVLRIAGVSRSPSRGLPLLLLRWLSGFALLQALQRVVYFVIALRRESEIELRGDALWVRAQTRLFGRTLRSSEGCYEINRVTGAFRHARFALLRSVLGVLALALGLSCGGYLLFDGARGGAPWLLLLGVLLVQLGGGTELLLNVLLPARVARVDVQLDLRGARSLRLGHVVQTDADRLLEALSLRLSR